MKTLCLTGWQQPFDALEAVAPGAQHVDYSALPSVDALMDALPTDCGTAIGWSLGGQLLVRAIAMGRLKAERLVLLGAAFCYLKRPDFPQGLPEEDFAGVVASYRSNGKAMLGHFNGLIAAGDTRAPSILRGMGEPVLWPQGLSWLEELGRFSCTGLDFSHFPSTSIIHGAQDKVTPVLHADAFARALPHRALHVWQGCGHAPHVHAPDEIKRLVESDV